MLNPFSNGFKTIPIDGINLILREPSAAITSLMLDRTKLFHTDEEGTMPTSIWRTIFVVALSYRGDGSSLCLELFESFCNTVSSDCYDENKATSVEDLFRNTEDSLFIKFICECAAIIPLSKLNDWFKLIDTNFYLSEKAKTELKND